MRFVFIEQILQAKDIIKHHASMRNEPQHSIPHGLDINMHLSLRSDNDETKRQALNCMRSDQNTILAV